MSYLNKKEEPILQKTTELFVKNIENTMYIFFCVKIKQVLKVQESAVISDIVSLNY